MDFLRLTGDIMNKRTKITLDYFKKLCEIPRPSGHEEKVSEYLKAWAEEQGYSVITDETGNLIIECPAYDGLEKNPLVILQAHMDMVCIAEEGYKYNEETDPIIPIEDGDYLKAVGTSLGGDDGIGIAISQYLADHFHERGPLRVIFTVDEEETTVGAVKLDNKYLNAPYLVNLDSEVSDKVMISSAGCMEMYGGCEIKSRDAKYKNGFVLKLAKGIGGHSGDDIDKGRLNALIASGRIMKALEKENVSWELAGFDGGVASNAIPTGAVIKGNTDDYEKISSVVYSTSQEIMADFPKENNLEITLNMADMFEKVIENSNITDFLLKIPNGVISMSETINNLVGTSSNIGLMNANCSKLYFNILVRAEVERDIIETVKLIEEAARVSSFKCTRSELTPSWTPVIESNLLKNLQSAYEEITGEFLPPVAVHAVLECAEFRMKNKKIEMVSISPDVYDVHSPNERLYIPSVEKVIRVLEVFLSNLNR